MLGTPIVLCLGDVDDTFVEYATCIANTRSVNKKEEEEKHKHDMRSICFLFFSLFPTQLLETHNKQVK